MNDIGMIYKKSIDNIIVPPYSMESMQQGERHRKFRRNLLLFQVCSFAIILIVTALISSGTAYAAHLIQRHIQITQSGSKIDSADNLGLSEIRSIQDSSVSDYGSVVHQYEIQDLEPLQEREKGGLLPQELMIQDLPQELDEISEGAENTWLFTEWEDAQKIVPFEIIYPNLSSTNYNTILYQDIDSRKLICAEQEEENRTFTYEILNFSSVNWAFSIDYNGTTENYRDYINVYGYEFTLYDVELEDDKFTHVSIAFPQYLIQMDFGGYLPLEIEAILDELDYSNYNVKEDKE